MISETIFLKSLADYNNQHAEYIMLTFSLELFRVKLSRILCYTQGSHLLEKYLNLEGFLEKSLKIKYSLKTSGKSLKYFEKTLNSSIFCRT